SLAGMPLVDEWAHYGQILAFVHGNYGSSEVLTMVPGYHLVVTGVARIAHDSSLGLARLVTMAFALLAIPAFVGIRRRVAPDHDPLAPTLAFAFFPIYFPFCFLVYTDVPSVCLVLWALERSLARRDVTAGALGLASMLVRQTNVVWVAFLAMLRAIEI